MKKLLAILLILTMVFTFAACGDKGGNDSGDSGNSAVKYDGTFDDYSDLDLENLVSLPDYNSYTGYNVEEVVITDDDIDTQIQSRLDTVGQYEDTKEGTCENGDIVVIEFHGTLDDGSSPDGMNSDAYELTLGSHSFISGFEEGLVGHKVGDNVSLDLNFPENYAPEDKDAAYLNGQHVIFDVTIHSRRVFVTGELTEDFIKEDSKGEATDEKSYREYVKNYLEEEAQENAVYQKKTELYNTIMENTVVSQVSQEKLDKTAADTKALYEKMAKLYGYDMDTFISQQLGMDEAGFDDYVKEYATSIVENRMKIFALAHAEEIKNVKDEYNDAIKEIIENSGCTSAADFEAQNGISADDYAEMYSIGANVVLDLALDKIFERITA